MNIYTISKKLLGSIMPYGKTEYDADRLTNLKNTTELVKELLEDISTTAGYHTRQEHSIKVMGEFAKDFISNIFADTDIFPNTEMLTCEECAAECLPHHKFCWGCGVSFKANEKYEHAVVDLIKQILKPTQNNDSTICSCCGKDRDAYVTPGRPELCQCPGCGK